MRCETPILLCMFNRPGLTERVLERIATARPKTLLVISDGPRVGRADDDAKVEQCRALLNKVDWDCNILHDFAETNLGCRRRMATGVTWAFEQVERVIVLEDDCLPDPHFFSFCDEMLERYADDPRVGMICGDQFLAAPPCQESAYFSKYAFIWGWASWRRAWRNYDLAMPNWSRRRSTPWLEQRCLAPGESRYWEDIFDRQAEGLIDTWDYSWMFNCWDQNLATIHPARNLVTNIGFGPDATHTTDASAALANLPTWSDHQDSPPDPAWTVCEQIWPEREIEIFQKAFHVTPPLPTRRRSKWEKLQRWIHKRWRGLQAASS